MTNRAIPGTLVSRTASRRRFTGVPRARWGLRHIQPFWMSMPLPTMEEVEERLGNYRGFFASLTPEQMNAIEAYDGPDLPGSPNGPRRKS